MLGQHGPAFVSAAGTNHWDREEEANNAKVLVVARPSVVEVDNPPRADLEVDRESFHGSLTHARQAAAEHLQDFQAVDTKNDSCSPKYSSLRAAVRRS